MQNIKSIQIEVKNPKLLEAIESKNKKAAMAYALSFIGIKPDSESIRAIRRSKIKDEKNVSELDHNINYRSKNHFLEIYERAYTLGSQRLSSSVQYFGIEIECFLNTSKLGLHGYSGEDSSYCECSACEGSGQLRYTNEHDEDGIERDCHFCDGTGEVERDGDDDSKDEYFREVKSKMSRLVKKNKIKGLDIKMDGSLESDDEGDFFPVEFTLVVPQNDYSNLRALCNLLESLDAKVNSTCGLHVHIDYRNETHEKYLEDGYRLEKYIMALSKMMPLSRRKNRYCNLVASQNNRYSAINLTAWDKYQTMEFRLHSGTTSYLKIANYLDILKTLKDSAPILSKKCSERKLKSILPEGLAEYYKQRVLKFSGSNPIDFEDYESEYSQDNQTELTIESVGA